ncbi:MAG TPA: T9SS type A sorting domain-containing protein [Flavobacteriales bacterium]|nr:T9SS type A sorting domain-containing protein [Flavobacteriales bacterium]
MPPVRFPDSSKARRLPQRRSTVAPAEPTLACYPNPGNANTYLTYPAELDGQFVVVFDAKGGRVFEHRLAGHGLTELNTTELLEGVYQVVVPGTSFNAKLSIQH